MDQTGQSRDLREVFASSAIKLVAITLFGFLPPMLAFIRRSRQKAAADAALNYVARHDALTGL